MTVNTAVSLAVGIFNDGAVTLSLAMRELQLKVGAFASKCFEEMDLLRIRNAERQARDVTHEARIRRRQQRVQQDEVQAQAEGFPYLAGAH